MRVVKISTPYNDVTTCGLDFKGCRVEYLGNNLIATATSCSNNRVVVDLINFSTNTKLATKDIPTVYSNPSVYNIFRIGGYIYVFYRSDRLRIARIKDDFTGDIENVWDSSDDGSLYYSGAFLTVKQGNFVFTRYKGYPYGDNNLIVRHASTDPIVLPINMDPDGRYIGSAEVNNNFFYIYITDGYPNYSVKIKLYNSTLDLFGTGEVPESYHYTRNLTGTIVAQDINSGILYLLEYYYGNNYYTLYKNSFTFNPQNGQFSINSRQQVTTISCQSGYNYSKPLQLVYREVSVGESVEKRLISINPNLSIYPNRYMELIAFNIEDNSVDRSIQNIYTPYNLYGTEFFKYTIENVESGIGVYKTDCSDL